MWCPDCRQEKLEEEFPRNRSTKTGRATYCKICHNARTRASRERLHGDTRHYHYMDRYGIGLQEFTSLLFTQGGLCAACNRRPGTQVDHDHTTGEVRGILCLECNAALGALRDDPEKILRAIAYLDKCR